MYVIIVYDVGESVVGKMLKLCRQYLCWIQNSVYKGELSEAETRRIANEDESYLLMNPKDSVIVFTNKMG